MDSSVQLLQVVSIAEYRLFIFAASLLWQVSKGVCPPVRVGADESTAVGSHFGERQGPGEAHADAGPCREDHGLRGPEPPLAEGEPSHAFSAADVFKRILWNQVGSCEEDKVFGSVPTYVAWVKVGCSESPFKHRPFWCWLRSTSSWLKPQLGFHIRRPAASCSSPSLCVSNSRRGTGTPTRSTCLRLWNSWGSSTPGGS